MIKIIVFSSLGLLSLYFHSPILALILGLVWGLFSKSPIVSHHAKLTEILLKVSIVGLGFGMNFSQVWQAGVDGFWLTLISITLTMGLGLLVGRWLRVSKNTSILISSGTAICGGSAIAAVSPIVQAKSEQISMAMAVVFLLNAVALLIFPLIGQWLELTQQQFGLWAALAIHDTSSVVGAASQYGTEALQTATTVKLVRALWILPLAFILMLVLKKPEQKLKFPVFILLFVLASVISSFFPVAQSIAPIIYSSAKGLLVGVLFLVGSMVDRKTIMAIGIKPFVQGVSLWLVVSTGALGFVLYFI